MPKAAKGCFYAVKEGHRPGIYTSWADCEAQITGYKDAIYKKFDNATAAEAFLASPSIKSAWAKDVDETGYDIVYSDGACKGNGKTGSVAGIGVWWGENDARNIAERCPGNQTNNRAELIAIVRALETTPTTKKPLMIKTDSQYSMNCLKDWLPKWKRNNFQTATGGPVKNRGLIEYLDALLEERAEMGQKVNFKYVKGHSGVPGNDGADAQANLGTLEPAIPERDWVEALSQVKQRISGRQDRGDPIHASKEVDSKPVCGSPSKATKSGARRNAGHSILPEMRADAQASSSVHSPLQEGTLEKNATHESNAVSPRVKPGQVSPSTVETSIRRQKARERAFDLYPDPTKRVTVHHQMPAMRQPPEIQRQDGMPGGLGSLKGSAKAISCIEALYPCLEEEIPAKPFPHYHPTAILKTPVKAAKFLDLDELPEPTRSPRKTAKKGGVADLPSASERYQSMNGASSTRTTIPRLTAADINVEDYADCWVDDESLLREIEDR